MKKIKFCVAAAVLSALVLSGCGLARDGYIEEHPDHMLTPAETPFVTTAPETQKKPAEKRPAEEDITPETPEPDAAAETIAPNM